MSLPAGASRRSTGSCWRAGGCPSRGAATRPCCSPRFARRYDIVPGDSLPAVINGTLRELRIVGHRQLARVRLSDAARRRPLGGRRAVRGALDGPGGDRPGVPDGGRLQRRGVPAAARRVRGAPCSRRSTACSIRTAASRAVGQDRQPSNYIVDDEMEQLRTWATVVPLIFLSVSAFLVNVVLSRLVQPAAARDRHAQGDRVSRLRRSGSTSSSWSPSSCCSAPMLGVGLGGCARPTGSRGCTPTSSTSRSSATASRCRVLLVGTRCSASVAAAVGARAAAVRQVVLLTPAEAMRPPAPGGLPSAPESSGSACRGSSRRPGAWCCASWSGGHCGRCCPSLGIAAGDCDPGRRADERDAFEYLLDVQFSAGGGRTLSVGFPDPVPGRAAGELAQLPGVTRAEGIRAVAVRIERGHRYREVPWWAYADGAELRRVVSRRHRAGAAPAVGAAAHPQLAEILGIEAGRHRDGQGARGRAGDLPPCRWRDWSTT